MTSEYERRSAEMKVNSTSSYREDDCASEVARKTKGGRLVPSWSFSVAARRRLVENMLLFMHQLILHTAIIVWMFPGLTETSRWTKRSLRIMMYVVLPPFVLHRVVGLRLRTARDTPRWQPRDRSISLVLPIVHVFMSDKQPIVTMFLASHASCLASQPHCALLNWCMEHDA